ncbi:MAG: radical SAM protein [Candidatus Eisenbacteria bacterium]|nr:radical SAM protein [Candidatus Eisenbacteria bacterium]
MRPIVKSSRECNCRSIVHLRVHRFLAQTRVEGPGVRACIWVQGCSIRCAGCAVPMMWPKEGGYTADVAELAQRILAGPQVEGVTFVGGEPFEQAAELANLGRTLRDAGLSIATFTGHTIEELRTDPSEGRAELLAVTDLLIDGPYRRDLADLSRPWVGSANQRYHFLTERYRHLQSVLDSIPNRLEFRLQPSGAIMVNGMGDFQAARALLTATCGR